MGMFAFRRAKEREAAEKAASTPIKASKPKQKRKRKTKVTTDGDNNSSHSGSCELK